MGKGDKRMDTKMYRLILNRPKTLLLNNELLPLVLIGNEGDDFLQILKD